MIGALCMLAPSPRRQKERLRFSARDARPVRTRSSSSTGRPCPSCEVTVLDMRQPDVASRAKRLGVRSVPAVVINGQLADCCAGRGPDGHTLRSAGVGQSLSSRHPWQAGARALRSPALPPGPRSQARPLLAWGLRRRRGKSSTAVLRVNRGADCLERLSLG
jgi:glutaredoxin 3